LEDVLGAARASGVDLAGLAALPEGRGLFGVEWPFDWRPRSAVSLGVRLPDAVLEEVLDLGRPTEEYKDSYLRVNSRLDDAARCVAGRLRRAGHNAHPVPASEVLDWTAYAGLFPHKTAARLAGLGWIGKSALLITRAHGPRVRFATVLTDAPYDGGIDTEPSRCGSCAECAKVCPAGAIDPDREPWHPEMGRPYDAQACATHLKRFREDLGVDVCGLCVAACPFGRLNRA